MKIGSPLPHKKARIEIIPLIDINNLKLTFDPSSSLNIIEHLLLRDNIKLVFGALVGMLAFARAAYREGDAMGTVRVRYDRDPVGSGEAVGSGIILRR